MASAVCTVNSQVLPITGTTGLNVSGGSTITIALASSAGVSQWNINCTSSDGVNPNSAYATVNNTKLQNGFSATFTAPLNSIVDGYSVGSALQFTSIVNSGTSTQNTVTFGVWVLGATGTRMVFNGENLESNATYGVSADVNQMLAFAENAIALTGDVSETGNTGVLTVTGIQNNPVKAITLGASQDGYIAQWKNSDGYIEFLPVNGDAINQATASSFGVIELGGDLTGNGSTATTPKVKNVTGDTSGNVSIGASTGVTTFNGGISDGYVSLTNSYNLDGYEKDIIVFTANTVSKTLFLPQPSLNKGRIWYLKDIGGSLSATVTWTLARHGSEKIEGVAANYIISTPYFSAMIVCDGTNYWLL